VVTEVGELCAIADYGDGPSGFDAVVYPSMVVARRREAAPASDLLAIGPVASGGGRGPAARVRVARGDGEVGWRQPAASLGVEASAGAPWLLVPPAVRAAFDRVRGAGVAWRDRGASVGTIWMGVKSGCNAAFVCRVVGRDAGLVTVEDGQGRRMALEERWVRPLLRGEGVRRWRAQTADEGTVWPIGDDGAVVGELPDSVRRWLRPYRARLEGRADGRRGPWWALFRVDGSIGPGPRVVWSDIGRRPRAAVLPSSDRSVVLNSCYVVRAVDEERAWALAALLNSAVVGAWLNVLAEPARGGYRRYLAWTMGMLPIPTRWEPCCVQLAAAGRRAAAGGAGVDEALDATVLRAYGLVEGDVAALLAWERG